MRSRIIALFTLCLLLFGMFYLLLPTSAAADTWNGSITGGFTGNFDPAQRSVSCMAVFNHGSGDQLYAGTENDNGCRVYRYDGGTNWAQVNCDGFGNGNNTKVSCMAVYNNNLYAGTRNTSGGCEVWSYDGSSWTRRILFGGFISANNVDASAIAVYGSSLYVGTENDPASGGSGCQVWRNVGGSLWVQANTSGFGNVKNVRVSSLLSYANRLIAGTANNGGCEVHSYTGALNPPHAWDPAIATGGFGDGSNQTLACMAQYNDSGSNKLFMGTRKGYQQFLNL